MIKRLAIIPARGGSKRIPKKNIRYFCGRPMISYILETAKNSALFETIHVSTEDEEVNQVVETLGFEIEFKRPDSLSDDYAQLIPVLKFVTQEYKKIGQDFDQVWLLMPCSPLIDTKDLIAVSERFEKNSGKNPVICIAPFATPIEKAFVRLSDDTIKPSNVIEFTKRSQDLEEKYFDAGVFEVHSSMGILESEGALVRDPYIGHILPKHKAIDIDDLEDFSLAEMIYRGLNG